MKPGTVQIKDFEGSAEMKKRYIRKWGTTIIASAIGWLVILVISWFSTEIPIASVRNILGIVLILALIFGLSRVFRSKDEPSSTPRPWWRLSGTARFSFWAFGIMGFLALFMLSAAFFELSKHEDFSEHVSPLFYIAISYTIISVIYLNSAIRIRKSNFSASLST
jgi:hypothetical protein